MPLTKQILLFLDFDSTITTASTLPHLLDLPTRIHFQKHSSSIISTSLHSATAEELSSAYTSDLHNHIASYSPRSRDRATLAQELAYANSLRSIERASFQRGKQSFSDAGVMKKHIGEAALEAVERRHVRFREGWAILTRVIQQKRIWTGIISVSWSELWISRCVERVREMDGMGIEEKGRLEIEVRANEIMDKEERGIYVSSDKVHIMAEMVQQRRELLRRQHDTDFDQGLKSIYLGDSFTDLECLLAADVGIVVRDQETIGSEQREMGEALERIGLEVGWIGHWNGDVDVGKRIGRKRLWWAKDFNEICESGVLDLESIDGGTEVSIDRSVK